MNKPVLAKSDKRIDASIAFLLFISFVALYALLAWLVSGPGNWWQIDNVDGQNVFYGDDAYRFFLTRSVWLNPELYTYNFVLPGQLWLDGVLTWFVNGNIYYGRLAHAFVGAGSVGLTYLIGRQLNITPLLALLAATVLGLIPRFALMNLSFYGEVWLGFFLVLCLYVYLRKHLLALAFIGAWLPLIRPEGIFFLFPIAVCFLWHKRFWHLLWLVLPGFVFFVFLNLSFEQLLDYHYWRIELRRILAKLESPHTEWSYLTLYTYWLTLPAAAAITSRTVRQRLGVFIWGAALWLFWLQLNIIVGMATIENRYTFVLLPLVVVLWAFCCQGVIEWLKSKMPHTKFAQLGVAVSVLAACLAVGKGFLKTDNIKLAIAEHGYSWTFERMLTGEWDKLFAYYPPEAIEGRKTLVERMYQITENDKGVDLIAINTPELFLFLDPKRLRKDVRVGFLTNGYAVFHLLLDGQSFIQHPGDRMFTYLTYGVPNWSHGERRALVATMMPTDSYPYVWQQGTAEMYLFSYLPSHQSATVIEDRPDVTIERFNALHRQWYRTN